MKNKFFIPILLILISCVDVFAQLIQVPAIRPDTQAPITAMRKKAQRLYERMTGTITPIDNPVLVQMEQKLNQGQLQEAAALVTEQPNFYNITVKQMALKMSTREETIRIPFNDMAAMIVGVVRDETDARELLTGNFNYVGNAEFMYTTEDDKLKKPLHTAEALYQRAGGLLSSSTSHYIALDNPKYDLSKILQRVEGQKIAQQFTQREAGLITAPPIVVDNPDPAGVITSFAFAAAHMTAGTSRRPVEYTFRQFMCVPIELWADTKASSGRIGRDIDRAPGGDPNVFKTSCQGCHNVMDGFRGAFARYDYKGSIIHGLVNTNDTLIKGGNAQGIIGKINSNQAVSSVGYTTIDDSFVNNANQNNNANLFGWRSPSNVGMGVREFGAMVANSKRYSACWVKRVYETVCKKELTEEDMTTWVPQFAQTFEKDEYNLKKLFQKVSVYPSCLGGV